MIKQDNVAEAIRVFNYPFAALEEALCNAIYHRSYEIREPVEVKILPDRITISSFPGPDRSISDTNLAELKIVSRRYRNRRLGEFLKELRLTEGRGTGIPIIVRSLVDNGSEPAKIYTDENRTYFVIEVKIQKDYLEQLQEDRKKTVHDTDYDTDYDTDQVSEQVSKLMKVLQSDTLALSAIMNKLNLKHKPTFRGSYIKPAIELNLLKMTLANQKQSKNQEYRLTELGIRVLEILLEKDNHNG